MTRKIWDGKGEVGEMVYFTLNNGTLKGRDYLRARARRYMNAEQVERTIGNDTWLASRNGMLVAAVVRDAEFAYDFEVVV